MKQYTDQGKLVPTEIVIEVLTNAINSGERDVRPKKLTEKVFLVDGFPRNLEQALIYEQMNGELYHIVHFDLDRDVMRKRLIGRMEQTPVELRRQDDNPEVMRDRMDTFFNVSMAGINFYNRLGKVSMIDADGSPDEVFERAIEAFRSNIITISGGGVENVNEFESGDTLGRRLAHITSYPYIDCRGFFADRPSLTEAHQIQILSEFMRDAPYRNFILENLPKGLIHKKSHLGNVLAHFHITPTIPASESKIYHYIDSSLPIVDQAQSAFQKLNFRLCLVNIKENPQAGDQFLRDLESNEGFDIINFEELVNSEIQRKTLIGRELEENLNPQSFLKLWKKYLFESSLRKRRFCLVNIPGDLELIRSLDLFVFPIGKIYYFVTRVEHAVSARNRPFSHQWREIADLFSSKARFVLSSGDEDFWFWIKKE